MGINVRVQKSPKPLDVIEVQEKLERDLRSCMRCRFFYGNNRQCIAKKCVKEDAHPKAVELKKEDECIGCPYRQSERYCFPCMKKQLWKKVRKQGGLCTSITQNVVDLLQNYTATTMLANSDLLPC